MQNNFFNLVRLADSTYQSLFNQFWAPNTFMYASSVYVACLSIISFCLYCNRQNNLIYKVLNLAVLSVFVVALWSYLTDMTFIYIVYVLTFVSAVIMLFLSVVLMLPSSAISFQKRNSIAILSTLLEDKFVDRVAFFLLDHIILNILVAVLVGVLLYSHHRQTAGKLESRLTTILYSLICDLKRMFLFSSKSNQSMFSYINAEATAQLIITWSIFLLAVPHAQFVSRFPAHYSFPTTKFSSGGALFENLNNIQYELYVGSPLLMIVCAIGLLVALVGAALLVSSKINRK